MDKHVLLLAMALSLTGCSAPVGGEPEDAEDAGGPIDLFEGPMPDLLAQAHRLQQNGVLLEIPLQREIYDYGRTHTDDARPWLLLARDSVRREWAGFAVSQYGLAIEADVRAKRQPEVLPFLIEMVAEYVGYENEQATELIRSAWGTAALSKVEDAREEALRAGRTIEAERLATLQKALAR
jgi:hypothetical protein